MLGYFNARVDTDHEAWPVCLGRFRVWKSNENGQRLLEFCTYHDLCITNKYTLVKSLTTDFLGPM